MLRLMVLDSSYRKILYSLDQKNAKLRRTIKTLKLLTVAYTLLISGNMRYDTNILKIHSNGMQPLKKKVESWNKMHLRMRAGKQVFGANL